MENDKGDDFGLPQENLAGDEPIGGGPAPEDPDLFAADAPLDDLDFEPLDFPQDGASDDGALLDGALLDGALLEGAEPGDIDPDMFSPDPLAETADFGQAEGDGLPSPEMLSPDFGGDETASDGVEPGGFVFPMGDESISDFKPKAEAEDEPEEKEEKESFLQKLASASPYTVMLGIALLAVVMGILFLFLELKSYDFKWKRDDARVQAPYSAPADPLSDRA